MSNDIIEIDQIIMESAENIIENGRNTAYRSVNAAMIYTYWQLGKLIAEEEQKGQKRAQYGSQLIKQMSARLTARYGKGFSVRSLSYFRKFYNTFNDIEILHTHVQNLTWSHLREILRLDSEDARNWYLREASGEGWSVGTLARNIDSQYFERLLLSQNKKPVKAEMKKITAPYQEDKYEFIKNPVVAEFLGLKSNIDFTEKKLEKSIISHIQKFIMEMGKGYAFIERQQHIRTEHDDYFIDLVFYNHILKCFVLIDLKTSRITHQDVGQMDMYIRMYDERKRSEGDNPTIGIILCSETDEDIARYSVLHGNEQLFASKYKLYLPSREELRTEIERQKRFFLLQQGEEDLED